MTRPDNLLEPLSRGIWEVVIPNLSVPGGLSPSSVSFPRAILPVAGKEGPVPEVKTEGWVHLDRYDPKAHSLLHLADDAPLVLMISRMAIGTLSLVLHSCFLSVRGVS